MKHTVLFFGEFPWVFFMTIVQKFKCQFQWWDSINIFMIIKRVTINVQCGCRRSTYNTMHFILFRLLTFKMIKFPFVSHIYTERAFALHRCLQFNSIDAICVLSRMQRWLSVCNMCANKRPRNRICYEKNSHWWILQPSLAFPLSVSVKVTEKQFNNSQFMNKNHTNKYEWNPIEKQFTWPWIFGLCLLCIEAILSALNAYAYKLIIKTDAEVL